MISLHGLLALSKLRLLALVALGVVAIILLIAFIVGAVKGFRRISWYSLTWGLAGGLFVVAYKFLHDKNPIATILKGSKLAGGADFAWAFFLASVCIIASLLVFWVLGAIFRPREIWIRQYETDRYGFEYEDDYDDRDSAADKYKRIVKGDNPCMFSRIVGGVVGMVNVGAVLAVIASLGLLFVYASPLGNTSLGKIFDIALMKKALDLIVAYAYDMMTVGIILFIGFLGFRAGVVNGARRILKTIGIMVAIVICLAIPFIDRFTGIKADDLTVIGKVVTKFAGLFKSLGNIIASLPMLLGKLATGVVLAVIGIVFVIILNLLLKLLEYAIENATALQIIDGMLGVLVFLVIGVAVCILIWGCAYALDYINLLDVKELFGKYPSLAKEFFDLSEEVFKPIAKKLLGRFL